LHLFVNRPHRLVEIRDALRGVGYEISVLIALREIGDYVEALHAQLYKQGQHSTPEEFCAEAIATGEYRWGPRGFPFDYERVVGCFDELFGADQVDVVRYSPEVIPEEFALIESRLGITIELPAPIPETNLRIRGEGEAPAFTPELHRQIRDHFGDSIDLILAQHTH
jgi:hypothetical protein